ncbi:hypothetical protein D3C71_1347570 [compost metagenome]
MFQLNSDRCKMLLRENVEENIRFVTGERPVVFQHGPIDKPDCVGPELLQVASEIRFRHRRRGMPAHGRMAVEAMDGCFRSDRGKEIAECAITAERRLSAEDHGLPLIDEAAQDGHCRCDIADMSGAVEGRAAFVVQHSYARSRKELSDRAELGFHGVSRHGTRRTGYADGIECAGHREMAGRGDAKEKESFRTSAEKCRQRIRGAGEVVAIPAVEGSVKVDTHAALPKNSRALRSGSDVSAASSSVLPFFMA